jgi:hypothetical protein
LVIYRGVAWNEAYVIRAFLQYNHAFKVSFFTSFLLDRHRAKIERDFPLMLLSERMDPTTSDAPGGSLWMTKVA